MSVREKLASLQHAEHVVEDIFSGIQTTYLRKKYVMENLSYTDVLVMPLQTGKQALQESVCYVPLSPLLGNLLSSTEILESVMQPIHQSKVLQDITDGDFLSQQLLRQEDSETPTIFLLLYSDELELSNPLGAAAGSHKILVVYFSLINIHPRHRSKLSAVHLLLLVRYPMVKKYGLDRVLAPLIQDLNYVHEHGMHAQGKHFNVVTVAFTGDNLSMHKMAGLQCCFSSGRICRFCLGRYGYLDKLFSEADCTMRTRAGHESHLKAFALNPAQNGPLYGISAIPPLQSIAEFDITSQLPLDAMHDILEGGMGVVMQRVLHGLVEDGTLQKSDMDKVNSFNYGFHDKKAAPVAPKEKFLQGKANLRGTASQKWCLFRLLPQIFGDSVPPDNPHWLVYVAYRHCIDIILAERIPRDCISYLQIKIQEFLEAFTLLYPSAPVTAKLHYLLHYPGFIQRFGPPRRYWGMRFEAKHAYFKTIASNVRNFRNICRTLSTRHQLLQAYELSGKLFESCIETTGSVVVKLTSLSQEEQAAVCVITPEATLCSVKTASANSRMYQLGDVIIFDVQNDTPIFLQVEKLLVVCGLLILLCRRLKTVCYSNHRCSYIVEKCNDIVAVTPGNEFDLCSLDLYNSGTLYEVVPHFAILQA
ncbi:uncharacterized protein LOC120839841 [Ixodes scapularis]|uniref:uncharacterized protein LOC120839841 n=1 Tax=Ixodes scapularis TaxID=6945 RepID=UPI001C386D12|nr:uncharacterized protein LOC120839841 [Ixodes scapularis]